MNKILITGCILAICLLINVQGIAQQEYSIVYDLYYQLCLNPEYGDELIKSNTALFDSRFYSCLSVVRQSALQEAHQHQRICDGHSDPQRKAICEAENEGVKRYRWTNEIQSVCQGGTLWSRTLTGSASILTKRNLDSLNPGQYQQIVMTTLPLWRPFFICQ